MINYKDLAKATYTPYTVSKKSPEDTMSKVSSDIWDCCELPYSEDNFKKCYEVFVKASKCFSDIIIENAKYNNLAARNIYRGFKKHIDGVSSIDDSTAPDYYGKMCYRLKGIASVFDALSVIITDDDLTLESDEFIHIMANALVHMYSEGNVSYILECIETSLLNVRTDNKQRYLIHLDAAISLMSDIIESCMPKQYENEVVVKKFIDLKANYTLEGYEKQKITVFTPLTRSIKALIGFFQMTFDEYPDFSNATLESANKKRSQNAVISEFANQMSTGNKISDAENTPVLIVYLLGKGIFDPIAWLKKKFGDNMPKPASEMADYCEAHPELF